MEKLFDEVREGTPVALIDVPYKFGTRGPDVYVEAHPPTEGADPGPLRDRFMKDLARHLREDPKRHVNWAGVVRALGQASGVPVRVTAD
jgi:hypothetical protein